MYEALLLSKRRKDSSIQGRNLLTETASDRSRVVFSSSFRRMQQKAQVFSLETNAAVRSRLTHTMEVADYGRLIAQEVTNKLIAAEILNKNLELPFINVVETACLLHDIGNLPFGHFGETAVQEWFGENWKKYYKGSTTLDPASPITEWMNDFKEFDGNPQGFRIITLLQQPPMDITGKGLNLTVSQLYAFLKYMRVADDKPGEGIYKKAGYFNSEKFIVDEIQNITGIQGRFPLTYIMEAADDMSYCLSDIEDGIEKGVLDIRDFFEQVTIEWENVHDNKPFPFDLLSDVDEENYGESFFIFKTYLARALISYASDIYVANHDKILRGETGQLFEKTSDAHYVLDCLKTVARKILFRSKEAENNELAGHAVILGLLKKFSPLMILSREKFEYLIQSKENPAILSGQHLDIQLRLFNRLPPKYVEAYRYSVTNHPFTMQDANMAEWYFRAHLIVDFISGMTDLFALSLYRLLNGIEIK